MTISDGLQHSEEFYNAVHEAGHAVASIILNLGLKAVTVDHEQIAKFPEDHTSGLTISIPASAPTPEQGITLNLCGMLAEIKARTGKARLTDFAGLKDTLDRAEDDLQKILAIGVDSGKAGDDAVNIVERNWEAIDAVAIRLMSDKTIDGETVAAMVEICR